MDRETVTRIMARVVHGLIAEHGWDVIDSFITQLDDELAVLRWPDVPELPPSVPEDLLVEVVLKHEHSRNGIRFGPGRCMVPQAIAVDLKLDDHRRELALRASPIWQESRRDV